MIDRRPRAVFECVDCAEVCEVPTDVTHEVAGCPYCRGDTITRMGAFDG